jgi:hypothetical protein
MFATDFRIRERSREETNPLPAGIAVLDGCEIWRVVF